MDLSFDNLHTVRPGSRRIRGGGHAGLLALMNATLWLDAAQSQTSGGVLKNLGTGGSALDAQYGSTTGADTNDPLKLTWSGTNYLYLPANAQFNFAQSPFIPAYNFAGDFELIARVNCDDWNTGGQGIINRDGAAPSRAWCWFLQSAGILRLTVSTDGTAVNSMLSTTDVRTVIPNGTDGWVRCTYVAATGQTTFYASASGSSVEPTSWTSLGGQTGGAAVSFAGTAALDVGNRSTNALPFSGRFYRAIVRNGIGGTTVFDADFTKGITSGGQTTFVESSSNAATVTINRATSGRKSVAVTRTCLLFGTDDYLQVADNALINFGATDSFTALVVTRDYGTPTASARFIDKWGASGAGYAITHTGTLAQLTAFTEDTNLVQFQQTTQAYTFGQISTLGLVFDRTAGSVKSYVNGVASAGASIAAAVSLTNANPLRVGANATSVVAVGDFELLGVAIWRRALSTTEIAAVGNLYGTN